jgi:2-oxoglutarate ferredoxin oxidoreductase subunit beta
MQLPKYPVALGVIRSTSAPSYDQLLEEQIQEAQRTSKIRNVDDLLNSGETWEI